MLKHIGVVKISDADFYGEMQLSEGELEDRVMGIDEPVHNVYHVEIPDNAVIIGFVHNTDEMQDYLVWSLD